MENSRLEEENIIKDIRNFFTLRKELNYTATRDMKNPFRREKETKAIKEESLAILRIFLSMKKKNCYDQVRVSNFWSNKYFKYESSSDTNITLSVEEYLNKTRPYLKDIINNLKKSYK